MSAVSGSSRRRRPEQPRDDLGVECRAALADPAHAVDEPLDVRDAVLEQVADALRVVGQQLERVGLLDVLGEHEHAGLAALARIVAAARRPSSVCVGGIRMSTIATSGLWARTLRSRSSASPAWATTSMPASSSSRATPSRSRTLVLGDDDSHGILARTVVPSPGGLSTSRRPSSAASRSARPAQPAARVGVAPPTPSSWTSTSAHAVLTRDADGRVRAPACLATFVSDSATTK